jgi:RHS repeat-associated protein
MHNVIKQLKDTLGDKLYDAYISSMLTPFSIDEVRLMERKTLYQVSTKCGDDKTFYRFGFNGKEQDPELKGKHNVQDYGFRMNDTRYGRFFTVDPLRDKYPYYTPYAFAGNTPIQAIDLDGLEPCKRPTQDGELQDANDVNTEKHRLWMGQVASDGATTWSDLGDAGRAVIVRPTKDLITLEAGSALIYGESALTFGKLVSVEAGVEGSLISIEFDSDNFVENIRNRDFGKFFKRKSIFGKDDGFVERESKVNFGGGVSLLNCGIEYRKEFDLDKGTFTGKDVIEQDGALLGPLSFKTVSNSKGEDTSIKFGIPEVKAALGTGAKGWCNFSINLPNKAETEKDASICDD